MSIQAIKWGYKRLAPGAYTVWMEFPALNDVRVQIGTCTKDRSKWVGEGIVKDAVPGRHRTRWYVAYELVKQYLQPWTEGAREALYPPMHFPYRKDRRLTVQQANAVWDVLVEFWAAGEHDRGSFTIDAVSDSPAEEWRCGLGKFRHTGYHFGLTQYSDDVTPWTEWIMARCGLRLQTLYEEFFGKKV
jgi:hypothetical protein